MKKVMSYRFSKPTMMVLLVLLLTALPVIAMAGGGGGDGTGDPFAVAVTTLTGWLKGGLGLLLSLVALGTGLIAGLRAGSVWGFAIGVGFALVCFYGPDVLVSVFGATLA